MKDNLLKFYVNKFCYLNNPENMDIDFIPPILRRRLSTLDKIALSIMDKVFSNDIENIIFSSQFGQCDRLFKMINQYTKDREVSPSTFSASVHNYSVGFFLLNKQKPIPYNAVSSLNETVEMGLLTSLISNYNNILFVYCDAHDNENIAIGLNLSKTNEKNGKKYEITMENSEKSADSKDFIKLFENKIDFLQTSLYTIKRGVE